MKLFGDAPLGGNSTEAAAAMIITGGCGIPA
jgi:hypothetical protein